MKSGGLRVTDPSDLKQANGHVVRPANNKGAPTPRRHTVTIGGMDLDTPNSKVGIARSL